MTREPAKSFQDLRVWQEAHDLVLDVYRFTAAFPKSELYGLTSQLRRAAVSIPANIAEGFKKRGKPDKARFLNTAQGSLEECRYYLLSFAEIRKCLSVARGPSRTTRHPRLFPYLCEGQ